MTRLATINEQGNWYRGNTHAHSKVSDGEYAPEMLVQAYKDLGYDFLAITDHRTYGCYESLSDDNFLVLPGVELDVRVPGQEAICHHVVGLGLPGQNKLTHGQRITYPENTNVRQMTAYLRANGNLCIYAHPNWSHVYPEHMVDIPGLVAMEIFNNTCEVHTTAGSSDTWYDRMLWSGQQIWCVACDDTHQHQPDLGGGFIRVKAEHLNHASIMEAILAGSFHASQGPLIDQFHVENGEAYIACSACCSIGLLADSHPGMALNDASCSMTEGSFTLRGTERYVRVVVKDSTGKKAWSQPIWL